MDKTKFEWLSERTANGAAEYLEAMQQRVVMLKLYQHYFSDSCQKSTANPRFTSPDIYSEKELEFLTFVNEQFFPLEALLDNLERLPCIPVEPLGTSWYYESFDELGATEKFLMCLIHSIDSDVWQELESDLEKDLPDPVSYICYPKLSEECKKARGMISHLPLALDMLTQSTGNIWLDITYENDVIDAEWTIETIDALRESYIEAQAIGGQYRAFIEWLDLDSQNCVKVVRLWNRCKEPKVDIDSRYLLNTIAS